jgi:hypothetical protein
MPLGSLIKLPNSNKNFNEFFYWKCPIAEFRSPCCLGSKLQKWKRMLEMELLCRDFIWFLLPEQQFSLFPLKAAVLFLKTDLRYTINSYNIRKVRNQLHFEKTLREKNHWKYDINGLSNLKKLSQSNLRFLFHSKYIYDIKTRNLLQTLYIQLCFLHHWTIL